MKRIPEISFSKVVLTEVAPGINLDKNILSKIKFKPEVSKNLKEMDQRIFKFQKWYGTLSFSLCSSTEEKKIMMDKFLSKRKK